MAERLPAVLGSGERASAKLVAHVEQCLACQLELARYRKLLRLLNQLRAAEAEAPAGLVGDVLRALEGAASRRAIRSTLSGSWAVYAAAVAAAAAAGTSLVFVARARTRSRWSSGLGAGEHG